MLLNNNNDVLDYINKLENYRGYVQFSHRQIDIKKDVFITNSPLVENENGFIYEAHFSNKNNSISIKQINSSWFISETNIENIKKEDENTFYAIKDIKVKTAQIWEKQEDKYCENLLVNKIKKLVFIGFEGERK